MPPPLTVSCFSKIQIGLPFWYRLTRVVLDKGPLNESLSLLLAGAQQQTLLLWPMLGQTDGQTDGQNGQKDECPTDAYYAGSAKMANHKIQLLSMYVKCILLKK